MCFRWCFVFLEYTKQVYHRLAKGGEGGTLGSRRRDYTDDSAARRHLSARLRRMSTGRVLQLFRNTCDVRVPLIERN